jgi:hypothetical protein
MARPWESIAPRSWEAAQPIYNRVVSIRRLKTEAGSGTPGNIGLGGYSGAERPTTSPAGETVLFSNIPCSIQAKAASAVKVMLPDDMTNKPTYMIEIPANTDLGIVRYAIRDRDIVQDDEGYRYGVQDNEWTVFGYNLRCIRLET